MRLKPSIYNYYFAKGEMSITRGITTKFDWEVTVKLHDGFIHLDRKKFLTKKEAKSVTLQLLNKYKLL
jgi:hypothetical protein